MRIKAIKLLLLILILIASQINSTGAYFISESTVPNVGFSMGCWAKPHIPVLQFPSSQTFTNNSQVVFNWSASTSPCTSENLTYQIQIATDSLFNHLVTTSNWLTQTSFTYQFLADGTYFWRVQSRDADNNLSGFSQPWQFTLDTKKPDSIITRPWNSDGDNDIKYIYLWNGKIEGTSSDTNSGVDHVEISIQRMVLDLFWDGSKWVTDSQARVNVGVSSPDNRWFYDFKNLPPIGIFKIVSHAVDKAGNIENSATIIFENTDVLPISSNLKIDKVTHTLNLTVNNIPSLPLDYEITYTNQTGSQGFAGSINQVNYSNNFYLGTCSSMGACLPDNIEIGSSIVVSLGGQISNYSY